MKREDLQDALDFLDESLLLETESYRNAPKKQRSFLLKHISTVAAAVFVLAIGVFAVRYYQSLENGKSVFDNSLVEMGTLVPSPDSHKGDNCKDDEQFAGDVSLPVNETPCEDSEGNRVNNELKRIEIKIEEVEEDCVWGIIQSGDLRRRTCVKVRSKGVREYSTGDTVCVYFDTAKEDYDDGHEKYYYIDVSEIGYISAE